MDFIQFILVFATSFIIFRYIADFLFEIDKENVKCELHSWSYGEDGRMFCTKCKKKALDD